MILLLNFGPKFLPGVFTPAANESQNIGTNGENVVNISPSEEKIQNL